MSARFLAGRAWKTLEMEEQAEVRRLQRLGRARIVGAGADRFVEVFVGEWVRSAVRPGADADAEVRS